MTERMLQSYVDPSRYEDEDLVGRIQAMTERMGREVFLRQNSVVREDGEAVLRSFAGPKLILCGEHDQITPLDTMQEMAAIAGVPLTMIRGSGHMTPMEKPREVCSALRDWLLA
jgi:pimeloyl-ACP methyl ester carboxylesterase